VTDSAQREKDRVLQQAEMLGNRLDKNHRKLRLWLSRERVSCFRVYDCDIPELQLTVDVYIEKRGPTHAVLAWFEGGPAKPPGWLEAMRDEVARRLRTEPSRIHVKVRARQEGDKQYERLDATSRRMVVEEGGSSLLVNLDDYLDTGLFLDHRPTRMRIRAESSGRDVLNLFAYTGAFSVHAAAGGARSTTTVDLSQTYLDWARSNLDLNGFPSTRHAIFRADVLSWLDETRETFDLVVVDPPTFSNSKRMDGVFDVQRDHGRLLEKVARVTRPGGIVYFSTNFRKFKPTPEAFEGFRDVTEISETSVPPDFRDRKIHRAWRLVRE
jgi:23S rRNA (guanine2445-N2)-methyltransferase / 23S rRNA (guanine2069-N7)-methyltransferase